ncbi:cupin domain-containing protein [Mycobacterium simiae]|uniref:Cupin domain-containing protein n=1 Tax=Mycobacterium simiae TaxID=1784 RepID=A0A5B1BQP6_MYCSI|nr:cupin domain-containing protein [Mycobacterium simiae]KAA1249544.1 cupin domain-containing protein [Mycobacterium simiae]
MNVTRVSQAPEYTAALHRDVLTVRLQGYEAGPTERFWVGLSTYRPGGIADLSAVQEEAVYVVIEGELVVRSEGTETVLSRLDSVYFAKGEVRTLENRCDREALLLVAIAHSQERES